MSALKGRQRRMGQARESEPPPTIARRPTSALAQANAAALLKRTLDHFEPGSLTAAKQLPLPPHTRADDLLAAWEIYHHDRGRGLN